jgi:protocatechuate 4,5-dioxygenase beta chain
MQGRPEPPEAAAETPEVVRAHVKRIDAAFEILAQQVGRYRPDALIMVGDDQGEMFDPAVGMPTIGLYLAAESSGTQALDFLGSDAPEERVVLRTHQGLSDFLARELMHAGFDLTCMRQFRPLGRPERGLGHAFTRPAPKLMPNLDIPVVIIFLNAYFPPLPSAQRCFALGRALRELLQERPERVAIYGSGGLSHDPTGPRAGWIDQPLDRFVLESLAAGKPERLLGLYTFDSEAVQGGTGEIRSWITVAGAFPDCKATVVDYIPAYRAYTGLGFAYWLGSS